MRPELSEAIDLLRGNSPDEIERAIGLLQKTVYSFSVKVCGHPEDAEDTMQEVLYRSLQHLARIEDPSALAVWLYTVTRNRCWRMRRKESHTPTLSLDELMPDGAELGCLLQDGVPGPERRLLQGEQQHLLQEAVLRLPPQLRIVLVLHDMEELDTGDVAKVLGVREGTVRVRLHRARLAVRKELGKAKERAKPRKGAARKARPRPANHEQPPAECRDLFVKLSEYLDGRVEPPVCDRMREHIEACPACVAFIRDLRSAIDRCRSLTVDCDPAVTRSLGNLLTREYLRLMESPGAAPVSL